MFYCIEIERCLPMDLSLESYHAHRHPLSMFEFAHGTLHSASCCGRLEVHNSSALDHFIQYSHVHLEKPHILRPVALHEPRQRR